MSGVCIRRMYLTKMTMMTRMMTTTRVTTTPMMTPVEPSFFLESVFLAVVAPLGVAGAAVVLVVAATTKPLIMQWRQ